jgi:hypothetical protein
MPLFILAIIIFIIADIVSGALIKISAKRKHVKNVKKLWRKASGLISAKKQKA